MTQSIYLNNTAEEDAVRRLGEDIGFGRVMQLAESEWRKKNAEIGMPDGAEHTRGPCAGFMVPCDHNGEEGHKCDWCCGAGRVTKRVAQAMKT